MNKQVSTDQAGSDPPARRRITRSMTISSAALLRKMPQSQTSSARMKTTRIGSQKGTRKPNRQRKPSRHAPYSPQSRHPFPSIRADTFPLIQEKLAHNLYCLIVQAMLWNQTSGIQARPVFFALIEKYPNPKSLSEASLEELITLLRPLGLQNIRARRCIALGRTWSENPPTPARRYRRKAYPLTSLATDTENEWEIAHLPGVGPYALDSFRIFPRDEMRGLAKDWLGTGATEKGFEPEWKRVLPLDKELKAYLRWRRLKEGFMWNEHNGTRLAASSELLAAAE
ncbi:hypothetical protein N7G274_008253 [Stereocaulon virgatum]|uniref:HhH-GPD domain-containing protein n=1 Tax=Stereocaulon virgatum TaxID=373712 RepID=A0ABR4A1K1_9LECA